MKERQGPVVDSHIHYKVGNLEKTEQVIKYLDVNCVNVAFLIPSPLKEGKGSKADDVSGITKWWLGGLGNSKLGHMATDYVVRPLAKGMFVTNPDNKGVLAATEEYPDRLMAWVWVNPNGEKQKILDETEMYLKHSNTAGSKMHFWIFQNKIANERIIQITEMTQKANKAILLMSERIAGT